MTPGESERASHGLELARQALRAARLILDAGALEDAASRLYYATFHASEATLVIRGLYAKTHSGHIDLFRRTHGGHELLQRLFELRGEADYPTGKPFPTTADGLQAMAKEAEAFIERCTALVATARARGPDEPDPPPDL